MAVPAVAAPELITGLHMSRAEFLRRWDNLPGLKFAELIEGTVYMPSPLSLDHGDFDSLATAWLSNYTWATPGCKAGSNATWLMLASAPQPDVALRILPEFGGQSKVKGKYGYGAPELALEICMTSTEVDFGPKLALYQRAGVAEYMTIELLAKRVVWRRLAGGSYTAIPARAGILRSAVFPGLWLNVPAFWAENGSAMMQTLQQGLRSREHKAFAEELRQKGLRR